MTEEISSLCPWCGKRITRGYHGSTFLTKRKLYCSTKCKEAAEYPELLVLLVALVAIDIMFWSSLLFVGNQSLISKVFLFLFDVFLSVIVGLFFYYVILVIRRARSKVPKGSRLE